VDQGSKDRHDLLVGHVGFGLLLYGLLLGWLCLPDQSNPAARAGADDHRTFLAQDLHSVQHALLRGHHSINADFVRGIPAYPEFRAYAGKDLMLFNTCNLSEE